MVEIPLESSQSPWTARRVVLGTLVALSVAIGFYLVYRFRAVVVILFAGVAVSMAIAPGVDWLHRRRLSMATSVILIYLLLLGVLATFFVLLVPPISGQITAAIPKIVSYYQVFRSGLMGSPLIAIRQIAEFIPPALNISPVQPAGGAMDAVGQAVNTSSVILNGLFTLLSIMLIGFYWTLEGDVALRMLLRPIPPARREEGYEMIREIELRVGGYLRGEAILAGVIGLADLVVFLIIGLPAALAVSLLAGMCETIPVFGPTLGAIPAILVAFAYDPSKVIWVIAGAVLIQFCENNIIAPRVMHKTVGLNPIVTLLGIVAFGALFGFAGLLLAIPMAAIVQIIFDRSILRPQLNDLETPAGRDHLSKLRYEAQEYVMDLRKIAQYRVIESDPSLLEPIEDSLEEIAVELDRALAQGNGGTLEKPV